jgi:hypothetical protein
MNTSRHRLKLLTAAAVMFVGRVYESLHILLETTDELMKLCATK